MVHDFADIGLEMTRSEQFRRPIDISAIFGEIKEIKEERKKA